MMVLLRSGRIVSKSATKVAEEVVVPSTMLAIVPPHTNPEAGSNKINLHPQPATPERTAAKGVPVRNGSTQTTSRSQS